MNEFKQLPRPWNQCVAVSVLLGLLSLSSLGCGNATVEQPSEEPTPHIPEPEHPSETPPQGTPVPEHPSAPTGTSLLLQVIDDSGNPVAGAAVSSQGALFPVDSSGHLLLENLPPGRLLARVDALGFTSATAVAELREGAHVGTRVKLMRLPEPIPFQAEQGGLIQTEQVRVTIPPGAVVDALGRPVTGTVNVTIAPLDPTRQLEAMPGPLEGTTVARGETVQLESFFMAEVSLWSNGAPVQLAPGKSATLEFVLPEALASQFQAGDTVPAWWFDLDEGQWREEGEGTLQPSTSQPGRLAWVVQVKHFTWWNSDKPWTDKSCVNVLVVDSTGAPLEGVTVNAQGVSYTGASWASTGANGRACLELKRGNTANVFSGLNGGPASNVVMVTGTTEAAVCGSGPCTEVRLTLADVICTPGAYETCAYTGPTGTEGRGLCRAGRRQCNVVGTEWSACRGEVLPAAESCRTPFDDDCDGVVNEDCSCSEQEGLPCYGGPSGTEGIGICHGGTVGCDRFGNVVCRGQQLPRPETCSTLADDNCNGRSECEPVPQWFWGLGAEATSCTSSSQLLGMAVDGEGNTLTLSRFSGTVTLGGAVFTGAANDLLLVKVDSSGQPAWAQLLAIQYRRSYFGTKESIAVDATGSVVVAGTFSGTLVIDGSSLVNEGPPKAFVAKFAPNGSLLWAQIFGGDAGSPPLFSGAVAMDAAGNVALLGVFEGGGIYVAKLDASTGAPLWSRSIRGSRMFCASAIDMDAAGDVLLAAAFGDSLDIDGIVITSSMWGTDAFVAKLEGATGKARWSRNAGRTGGESCSPPYLKVAGAGTVLVLTEHAGNMRLAKRSADGEELWSLNGTPDSWADDLNPQHLGVDAAGNALVSGTFTGSVDLGGGRRQSSGSAAFVAWYDPQGRYLKDHSYPTLLREGDGARLGSSWGAGAGVDLEGNVLLGGRFEGTMDFGMGQVSSCSSTTFLLKFDPTPPTPSHFNPIITRAFSSSETATPGQVLTFEVDAADPEGSALSFSWAAETGSPGTPVNGAATSRITWTAPSCVRASTPASLTATVTNAFNRTTTRRFTIRGLPSCEWASTGSMASSRSGHTATLLPDGKVLVSGGQASSGGYLATAEEYDPATGTWSATGSMTSSRDEHTATLLPNGKVLVSGGRVTGNSLARVEVYDPATGTWSATGSMASSRSGHTATLLPDGKVLVSGGYGSSGGYLATVEAYDPATGTWSATGSMASSRSGHTATLLPDGKVLVSGGIASWGNPLAMAEEYDPATGTWSPVGSMTSPRSGHTATLLPNGKVLVAGGYGSSGYLMLAEEYDPATGSWGVTGLMASSRAFHTATLLPNGKVLVSGGQGSDGQRAEVYDLAMGTWNAAGSMASPRGEHTATLLPNGKVLVVGGTGAAELYTP
jgi:N-acetylneuraminic acid mutarotase